MVANPLSIAHCICSQFAKDLASWKQALSWILLEVRVLRNKSKQANHLLYVLALLFFGFIVLKIFCYGLNSLALTAFSELVLFDVLALVVSLVSLWVKQKPNNTDTYCFGYDRFEVIAVFASTILAILSSFYLLKEAIECLFEPSIVETGYLPLASLFAFFLHSVSLYSVDNHAFKHVTQASVSNWLQEHISDISRSVCNIVPCLSRLLLPRINPLSLVGVISAIATASVYFTASHSESADSFPDTIVSVFISLLLFTTMLPMAVYCGKILLQTTPSHLVGTLDKALREASTLEGVLELQNEHFWTVGFGTLIGSLYVRVRRDADEQLVLSHVANRLHPLVQHLTIQVIKDELIKPTAEINFNWHPPQPVPSSFNPAVPILSQHGHSHQ